MGETIQIGERKIGRGFPCFIIAEAGLNHNADPKLAIRMVRSARTAGVDAIKFQTFKASRLVVAGGRSGAASSQYELLRRLELSEDMHKKIWAECRKRRVTFLSAPFDEASADFLDQLGVNAFKIASGELTHLRFLEHVARKRKPVILSTGMATLKEVHAAVDAIRGTGNHRMALLHCVSNYPTQPRDANLRAMETLRQAFRVPVGFSDHTAGIDIPLAAVALGANVIEKHFTLDSSLPGPDHGFSIEPGRLGELAASARRIESALGHGRKVPIPSELQVARAARKSLVAARPLGAGARVTEDAVTMKRPGTGLPPRMLKAVLGKRVVRDIPEDTLLTLDMFA